MSVNFPYRKAMYANCGLKMDYIKYESNNANTSNKQSLKNPHDTAISSLILFSNVAYKLAMFFTFFTMSITLSIAIYTVVVYLMGIPVIGWTTTMMFLSGAFFALFLIMSIIVKYLSLILSMVFNRQKYLIESVEKIAGRGR
jgi:dolichol-phosphate mannosyltransferase